MNVERRADQRDGTVVRCDGDTAADRQLAGAVGSGRSGRIRFEYETVSAVVAGDVGTDDEMATRLQG